VNIYHKTGLLFLCACTVGDTQAGQSGVGHCKTSPSVARDTNWTYCLCCEELCCCYSCHLCSVDRNK